MTWSARCSRRVPRRPRSRRRWRRARSIWTTATRTRLSASGRRSAGSGRAGGAGARPGARAGRVWNQTVLVGGRCTRRPSGRRAPRTAGGRGRPRGRGCAMVAPGEPWRGISRSGIPVGHLDAYAVVAAQTQDVGGGARVDHGVGDQFAGEDHGVVDDVGEAPALEGVADEGAGGRDRSPHGLEAGGRARGDHRTPRPVVDVRGCRAHWSLLLGGRLPVAGGPGCCPPGSVRWSCVRRPSDAPLVVVPPPRPDGPAWLDSRMQGYLPSRSARMPVGSVYRPERVRTSVRSCRTVMAGFGQGETLGSDPGRWCSSTDCAVSGEYPGDGMASSTQDSNGRPLREGHSGVWRSGAGH